MSLIVDTTLDYLYENVCSRNFIKKIFMMNEDDIIKKYNNGEKMVFDRIYNIHELDNIENLVIPDDITKMIESNLGHINVIFSTTHNIIYKDADKFIVKYVSILTKPEFVYTIVGEPKLVLYVQFSKNLNDPNKITIHWNKKFLNVGDDYNDNLILNKHQLDVMNNLNEQNKLIINESLVKLSETFLGKELVQECIIPYINKLFNDALEVIEQTYIQRLIDFLSKKHLKVYKKKN